MTSVGDFPPVETPTLARLTINDMQRELTEEISAQMGDMLGNWRVPTNRIISWFPTSRRFKSYGMWFKELMNHEILFSYYEMIKLGEGFHSAQVENLLEAHPLRVVQLSRDCGDSISQSPT